MCVLEALEDGAMCTPSTSLSYPGFAVSHHRGSFSSPGRSQSCSTLDVIFLGWPRPASVPFLIIATPHSIRVRPYEGLVSKGDST